MTIDLTELFKVQNILKERIGYKEPDHFDKLKLSLLVEVGECANEWRGFKFWSTDQRPRTFKREGCPDCEEKGYRRGNPPTDETKGVHGLGNHWYDCEKCRGFLVVDANPLLEEYVDGLHFVMELGLVILSDFRVPYNRIKIGHGNTTDKFNAVYLFVAKMDLGNLLLDDQEYKYLLTEYVELAEYLGFTWDQVEVAYYEKNAINHKRQESGY